MQTNKLITLIEDRGVKRSHLARYLGLTDSSFRNKVNGKVEFKASEMVKLREFFGLDQENFMSIFFS